MSLSSDGRPAGEARSSWRAHLQLLVVLIATWGVLVAHSLSKRELSLLGVTLEKADIEGYLREPHRSDEVAARARESVLGFAGTQPIDQQTPKVEPRRPVVPAVLREPDRSPQRILVFGDSMVKSLMWRLSDYCAENKHQMFVATWYGSTTIGWAVKDKLDALLAERDPTFVIVVLGASEVGTKDIASREQFIKQIVDKIGARKLVWVGPPNTEPDTGINDLIERIVGRDHFFRSEGLDLPRYEDHIHPNAEGGRTWMDAVARWIADESSVPILMATPTVKGPIPEPVIFKQSR
jgi:hypothetical protein